MLGLLLNVVLQMKKVHKSINKLSKLEAFLREIYTHASEDLDLESAGQFFSKQGHGIVFLSPEETRNYREVVADIMQAYAKDELISRRAVEKELQEALFTAFGTADSSDDTGFKQRLAKALQKLDAQLRRETTSYLFFVPVGGAGVGGLPYTFGKLRFVIFNDLQLRRFRMASSKHKVSEREIAERLNIVRRLKESDNIWNKPCAIIKVKARDREAASYLARLEAQNTFDTINFFANLIPYLHGSLYLPGENESRLMTIPVLEDSGSFSILRNRVGPLEPFDFNKFRNAKHIQVLVRRLHNFSKTVVLKEVEDILLTAVRWAGRAAFESRKEHAFLLYAIALESVVLPSGDTEQLSYRLRMRVAHLLEKRISGREELVKKVKNLYDIRSRIVHSGWYYLADEDLDDMRNICYSVLLQLLSHRALSRMTSAFDLNRWFERRMLR